jgi:hypothetical protein
MGNLKPVISKKSFPAYCLEMVKLLKNDIYEKRLEELLKKSKMKKKK